MLMLLRADASVANGTGHVMRCIALAQAYKGAGGQCTFVSSDLPTALASRLSGEQVGNIALTSRPGSPEDAKEFGAIVSTLNASWAVIDGYHFASSYYRTVKDCGGRLMVIEDTVLTDCNCADIVLRPSINVHPPLHSVQDRPRVLQGSQYALLRQEFLNGKTPRRYPKIARRLLVSIGGSDPDNVTATIMHGLDVATVDGGELVVIAGAINPHFDSLLQQAASTQWKIAVKRDVRNIATLMAWADVAIAAAGGTGWELAAMGVPSLLVSVADNQLAVAQYLHKQRAAINLGPATQLTVEAVAQAIVPIILNRASRFELSKNAQRIVDGRGANRVVSMMLDLETRGAEQDIFIRKANVDDSRLIWGWANDPPVRAMSFSSDPISWEDHLSWMARKLDDPSCHLYIGVNADREPVGQVRFDIGDASATLSIVVDARFRGKGLGNMLIRKAAREIFRSTSVSRIKAFVKPANAASISVFRRAGFRETEQEVIHGQNALCFVLRRRS